MNCLSWFLMLVLPLARTVPLNTNSLDLEALERLGLTPEELLQQLRQLAADQSNLCHPTGDQEVLRRHSLRNHSVTCNDGSRAGYYIRKTDSSKWLVFLEGGWYCFDEASCRGRWLNTPHLMSSLQWPDTRKGTGILSASPEDNPYMYDVNMVFVPYCSSDSWSGTLKAKVKGDFAFLGALIVEEVIRDLVELHGMSKAEKLMLAGTSAGGTGVLMNLDSVAGVLSQLAPRIEVRGISDSGWFLDNAQYRPADCRDVHACAPTEAITMGMAYWDGRVPVSCRSKYLEEPWRCYFGYRMYETLKTPVFVVQYLFDEAQITADNVGPPIRKEQWQYIHNMGKDLKRTLNNVTAVFAPACLSHSLLQRSEWASVSINGVTLPQAIKCWEDSPKERNRHPPLKRHRNQAERLQRLITGEAPPRRRHDSRIMNDGVSNKKQRRRQRRRKNSRRRNRDRERRERGGTRVPRHISETEGVNNTSNDPLWQELVLRDQERAARRRHQSSDDVSDSSDRERRSVLLFDEHDVHHMKYHDNLCHHRGVDQCAWPQCNLSCPKIRNPFTGQEMDFIDLLLQFGLDLSSIANALDMDLYTLQTMDHDHLLQLLTQH